MLSTIYMPLYYLQSIFTARFFFLLHLFYVKVAPGQHCKTNGVSCIPWHSFPWLSFIHGTIVSQVPGLLLASMAAQNPHFILSPELTFPEMTHVADLHLPILFIY